MELSFIKVYKVIWVLFNWHHCSLVKL